MNEINVHEFRYLSPLCNLSSCYCTQRTKIRSVVYSTYLLISIALFGTVNSLSIIMRHHHSFLDRCDFQHHLARVQSELAWRSDINRAQELLRGAEEHQESAIESSPCLSQHRHGYQRGKRYFSFPASFSLGKRDDKSNACVLRARMIL